MKVGKVIKYFICILVLFFWVLPPIFAENYGDSEIGLHTVACVFAGREKYLSILMPYLKKLQADKKLTEINLWQFTDNENDCAYLDSIANLHKTSKNFTSYRTITPLIEDNEFSIKIKTKQEAYILINDTYEIVLGGNQNTRSFIKKGISGYNLCEAYCEGILSGSKYQTFKIQLENGVLRVHGLMGCQVDETEIKSIKIHSGYESEGYWDYEETQNKNIKLFDTDKRVGCLNWGEAYKYYLNHDFDVFLKIDDDIVYMDLDRFDEFIEYIVNNPSNNCIFPNMINHAVSLFYNNKYGLIPDEILNENYVNKSSADDLYWYHTDGENAGRVHQYFLENCLKFKNNEICPINLDDHKQSICMFGVLKKNFNNVFDPGFVESQIIRSFYGDFFCTSLDRFDDEVYVYNLRNNIFYPRFVACHYQFGPQMTNGLDESYLEGYRKLSLEIG